MMKGRIKNYLPKGYGFIEPDEGGPDVFVHISTLLKAGIEDDTGQIVGARLGFSLSLRPDGRMMASDVKRLADE